MWDFLHGKIKKLQVLKLSIVSYGHTFNYAFELIHLMMSLRYHKILYWFESYKAYILEEINELSSFSVSYRI